VAARRAFLRAREEHARAYYISLNTDVFGGQLPAALPLRWSVHLHTTAGRAHLTTCVPVGQPRHARCG
jgi:hypothetical protein